MELITIVWTSIGSIVVLFLLTKLMGYREISELSMFDFINGITIGSIAAEMATDIENFERPLLAMVIYAVVVYLISYATDKSIVIRHFVEGSPVVLFHEDQIYYKNLKKSRIDINELLCQCRNSGYFDITQIQTIILESNGKFSILPKSNSRPATPDDLKLTVSKESMVANLVIDGCVMQKNLQETGQNEQWLQKQIKKLGYSEIKDLVLVTYDINKKLKVYPKLNKNPTQDPYD